GVEKLAQVGEEKRLIGDAGETTEDGLDAGAGSGDGAGEENHVADREDAGDRAIDHINVAAVVAERSEQAQKSADEQARASEANVLAVDALGNACVTIQQEGTQPEQLEFLRAFLAAADDAQVIEFAARGSLLESKPVGFESEVGLPKKGRNYADHEGK